MDRATVTEMRKMVSRWPSKKVVRLPASDYLEGIDESFPHLAAAADNMNR